MKSNFLRALSIMLGYIVGVGMFGLPFLTAKSGVLVFVLMLAIITVVQYFFHLLYANIIIETEGRHRLAGYAEIYLGKIGKFFGFMAKMIGNISALLAYIIIAGIFAYQLFSFDFGGSVFSYATIFFFAQATLMLFGISTICGFELWLTALMVLAIIFIGVKGTGFISISNYSAPDWTTIPLMYGAILFALDGIGSVPIAANLVKDDKKKVKKLIRYGIFLSSILMLLFTLVVAGVTGAQATPDSLTGLKEVMGDGVVALSLVLGLLVVITSFIGVGEAVKEMLMYDFKLNKYLSWGIAMFLPYGLYLIGYTDLIKVISFSGSIAGGIGAILLILIFRKMESTNKDISLFKRKPTAAMLGFLALLFLLGIGYEIYTVIFLK